MLCLPRCLAGCQLFPTWDAAIWAAWLYNGCIFSYISGSRVSTGSINYILLQPPHTHITIMSSIITSLTPTQVNDELHKMQQFIQKEAEEKAREIELKADQEYEIEKAGIVRQETASIDANAADKLKKAALKQQIAKSTVANKTRLKVLTQRQASLNEIFDEAKEALAKITKNKQQYRPILHSLVLEGLLKLLEPAAVVRVTEADKALANELIPALTKEYKEVTKRDVQITVATDNFLSRETVIGGAIVSDAPGKIELDNTLAERLTLLSEEALPAIRLEMFGISKTRKFFD